MSSEYTLHGTRANRKYTISSLSERPELADQHQTIGGSAWPEFMLHDPVAIANWEKMMTYFAGDQLSMHVEGQIAAVINMVPIRIETGLPDLPDRGVDWGVEKSVSDFENDAQPNALMGLQVVVAKPFRGQKLSEAATQEMVVHARMRNCNFVLIPVRPSEKHNYPLIEMEQYIDWKDADGQPFDGWLRVHNRLGGQIVKVCYQSMIIPGTIAEWEKWTGQRFPGSGRYVVPFALNPIEIDKAQNIGRYIEPNVWVVHHARL